MSRSLPGEIELQDQTGLFRFEDIAFTLGERKTEVAALFPQSSSLVEKTGIPTVWESSNSAYEMALQASTSVLARRNTSTDSELELILYVTQSPSQDLPAHACMLQSDLGLRADVMALDINQGCSGFVQALALAVGFLSKSGSALIVTADAYRSKLSRGDRGTGAIFSDGAAATLISRCKPTHRIHTQLHLTDGTGAQFLHQFRHHPDGRLAMNGREVFLWTRRVVLPQILRGARAAALTQNETGLAFLHQASKLVLDNLSPSLESAQFVVNRNLHIVGNTVSSSIPILIHEHISAVTGKHLLLAGFGVGLSSSTLIAAPLGNE